MKHRFETQFETKRSRSSERNFLLSVIGVLVIAALFWLGTSLLAQQTDSREAEILEKAVTRGVIHCYACEGAYPESLQYLKENYGLTYDEQRFFIDYQAMGSNLMPNITIIDKGGRQ